MSTRKLLYLKSNSLKFFIVMMGPGEIGQGMAFAKYAHKRGSSVILGVTHKDFLPLIRGQIKNSKPVIVPNSHVLKKFIHSLKPNILVLCNSKIYTRNDNFPQSPPKPPIPSLSIDSNWLFFPKSPYIFNPWIDVFCVNLPKSIFLLGLKGHGGHYAIPKNIFKKIAMVGLLPSGKPLESFERRITRKKYGIEDKEKLIFLYTSIGYMTKPVVFSKAVQVTRSLIAEGEKIKMVYFGDPPPSGILERGDKKWLIIHPRTSTDNFNKVLASSDLVIQHQGLGTLSQALCARIPLISIVRDKKHEKCPQYHRHAWEVGPFARSGAIVMYDYRNSLKTIASTVKQLLFNRKARAKMRKKQKSLYSHGEKNVYQIALALIKNS